jgi:hypothetical protein
MKLLSKLKKLQEESKRGINEVPSDCQPDVVVCSPVSKKDPRTNKFSTPATQSKIRYCLYRFIYFSSLEVLLIIYTIFTLFPCLWRKFMLSREGRGNSLEYLNIYI